MEKMGMGRQDPGVSLYSRKVLIQPKSEAILPDWLRFLKGVVDCEDIPLNISRESMQDTPLLRKLNRALTTRIIKWLKEEAKTKPEDYKNFFDEFGRFLKEGVCIDSSNRQALVPLLRYESSHATGGVQTSFDDYVDRMDVDQKEVYYLTAPNRYLAESSPYYEAFSAKGVEVFFVYQGIDAFVMDNIREFKDKKVVNVESSSVDMEFARAGKGMTSEESSSFCLWLARTLGSSKVVKVKPSQRLVNSPCIVVNHDSAAYREMMKMVSTDSDSYGTRQELEVNLDHNILIKLNAIREAKPELAKEVAEQVFDNALVAAGILDDPRSMITRINSLLETCMEAKMEAPPDTDIDKK